jgi:ATP-binding protein involved in chromosome partitioning
LDAAELPQVAAHDGHIHVNWPDGTDSAIPNKEVRASCQCAACREEYTGEQLLDPTTIPETIEAKEISSLGNYAVAISWSDGHTSGIFSWDHLRGLTRESTV